MIQAILCFCVTFVQTILLGHLFITYAGRIMGARARKYTPDSHRAKDDTPTMGGIFVGAALMFSTLCWRLFSFPVFIIMLSMVLFGTLGGYDDWCKISRGYGISSGAKFMWQIVCSAFVTILLLHTGISSAIVVPFVGWQWNIGPLFFILWGMFVLVGCSNAVNLTDGLDGLAASCLVPNFLLYSVLAAATDYACALTSLIIAASVSGFLYFNRYPARVFMGDIGSLALGAGLGCIALMQKAELCLAITGIIFVVETMSVMIQVLWYKKYKKKFFKMAPIHHHFELMGYHEKRITLICALISGISCGVTAIIHVVMR
ncbi:MAG TPA: phospho-N-acetylmuramoyl-pentapeptide-transferase [Candidatus Bathyarchaeia archaeon]|nr:phospho-N-acetylmuramoyl-pentapeptide-transferase [Candidatus Bathyarchaeia archaeon]